MRTKRLIRIERGAILQEIHRQSLKRYWIAEMAGLHETTLRRWLSGRVARARASNLERVALVMGVSAQALGSR